MPIGRDEARESFLIERNYYRLSTFRLLSDACFRPPFLREILSVEIIWSKITILKILLYQVSIVTVYYTK